MTKQVAAQVLARAEEQLMEHKEQTPEQISFEEVVAGRESLQTQSPRMKELYRRITQMEQECQLDLKMPIDSHIPGGRLLKRIGRRILISFLGPLIGQQSAYNLEVANCLRGMTEILREMEGEQP